jgi:two-component system chemotaxis sensor kinase CheA
MDSVSHAEQLLQNAASHLPLVNKADLTPLTTILTSLEELAELPELPGAFITMAQRAARLTNHIILEETDFDKGCKKLGKSIEKMIQSLPDRADSADQSPRQEETSAAADGTSSDTNTAAQDESGRTDPAPEPANAPQNTHKTDTHGETPEPGYEASETDTAQNRPLAESDTTTEQDTHYEVPDDMQDMVKRFAQQQRPVMEDFEAYILELEKGDNEAWEPIRGTLHTWKGEFGVIDFQQHSSLIHAVEQAIHENTCTTDMLFRLKDFLYDSLEQFAGGQYPKVTHETATYILGTAGADVSPGTHDPSTEDTTEQPSGHTETKTDAHEAAAGSGDDEGHDTPAAKDESGAAPDDTHQDHTQGPTTIFEGDASMMGDFIVESREHLDSAESNLLDLEVETTNVDKMHTVFRAFHTIKGVAGFLGLKEVAGLSHSMENLMDKARNESLTLHSGHIDTLLSGVDCIKQFVTNIENIGDDNVYTIPDTYTGLIEKLKDPDAIPAQKTEYTPDKKVGEILNQYGNVDEKAVKNALEKQHNGDRRKIGEILIQDENASARHVAQALGSQKQPAQKSEKKSFEETIRVPVSRVDQLVDAVGEAVIAQSMIAGDRKVAAAQKNDSVLEKKISRANVILRQVQELSMSLRMVSIKPTFQKMNRLVRDLSKKFDKEIECRMEGEDTELDKSVVEHIGDPLLHLVRNAVDHGIEADPRDRTDAGKTKQGTITLRAFHKAGSIYIEIEDDGKGLDKDAIVKKAVANGLCKQDDKRSDQEIYQYIFNPGFSTAKSVSDVSGRGVGMDVVKRNIESLRGSVEIKSEKGVGSTFSIRLPLTLAIIDGMIVKAGKESYIVPTLSIIRSLRPKQSQISSVLNKGEVIDVRGELIRFTRLHDLFNIPHNGASSNEDGIAMIVEDMLGRRVALLVDDIVDQQQVVIKSLGDGIGDVPGIAGGAIMSDGNVSLILDIGGLLKMAESVQSRKNAAQRSTTQTEVSASSASHTATPNETPAEVHP